MPYIAQEKHKSAHKINFFEFLKHIKENSTVKCTVQKTVYSTVLSVCTVCRTESITPSIEYKEKLYQ